MSGGKTFQIQQSSEFLFGNFYTDMQTWEKAIMEKITSAKMQSIKIDFFSPIKLIVLKLN